MTNYKKVKIRLKAALTEYKKDESGNEQLSTGLYKHIVATSFSNDIYDNASWEEAINCLIRSVSIVQGREKSGFYDGNPKADIHQVNQCGTCASIDVGKAQDPCYGCVDFDKWSPVKEESE